MSWKDIRGWLPQEDKELFDLLLTGHRHPGDLAEIGTYLGASAVVIGAHRSAGETFTVVDLFDSTPADQANAQENADQYPGLTRAEFESNCLRELGELPVIIQGSSESIVDKAAHRSHRFVHVDASHLYEQVVKDVAAAHLLLREDGVVVFDDIRSPHTPGVSAAVWAAVANDDLRPFAITEQKLYGTWGDAAPWFELVERWAATRPHEIQEVAGDCLLRLERPPELIKNWLPPALLPSARKTVRFVRSARSGARRPRSRGQG